MDKNSILIAIPCYGGFMHSYTASSLFSLGKLLAEKEIASEILTPSNESFIPTTRNHISNTFLNSEYTHLMCIDSDIQFDPTSVLDLLSSNVDIIAAHYRLKTNERIYCSYSERGISGTDISEVDHVGHGFMLIKKEVYQKLSPFVERIRGIQNDIIFNFYSPIIENGVLYPEDISFQRRWRSLCQGKIYLDQTIKLGHYGGWVYK